LYLYFFNNLIDLGAANTTLYGTWIFFCVKDNTVFVLKILFPATDIPFYFILH